MSFSFPSKQAPLLIFASATLVACGGEEAFSVGMPSEAQNGNQLLFVSDGPGRPAELQDELARRDAEVDGWDTEVLHDHAKHALKGWMHDLLNLEVSAEKLAAYASSGFESSASLVRGGLPELRDARGWIVRRAENPSEELFGFADLNTAYRARVAGSDRAYADIKIIGVEVIDAEQFSTEAYVQTLVTRSGGAPLQFNHEWNLYWEGTPETDRPKLVRIETLSYEEVEGPRPLLGDLTEHLFGDFEWFDSEFRLGAGELYRRKDRLAGNSYMGWQGLAIGDVNNDGYEDIYVCQPGGLANRLFLRQPDGSVQEVAGQAGVAFMDNTRGALLLDLDNDADQDLIVSMGPNLVIGYNDGRGRFPHLTPLVCEGSAFVHSLTAADIDRDGDLDLYACRYNLVGEAGALGGGLPVPYHDADNGGENVMWRNDGRGMFTDVTSAWGLDQNNTKFSLGAIFEDFDEDGDLDLYVTNDFGRNNYYRNGGGRFSDAVNESGLGELAASMGASAADFDRDGDMDIYLSNMFSSAGLRIVTQEDHWRPGERESADEYLSHARGNFLLANQGDGTFVDRTDVAGVELGRWAWGARFVDFDNDGFDDIYVPNGFITGPDTGDL
ncbi:MAG: VCBS repeat-containing protein [Planctomycetes bacterium]|nr:VCBS repeat-containing protein [Planctomycetota bacterium]